MFNVRLAGGHLYGKQLAVAGGVFDGVFVLSFFSLDVLDEIWDLIESVSEGFSYLLLTKSIHKPSIFCSKLINLEI